MVSPVELLFKQLGFDPAAMKENFNSFMLGVKTYMQKDDERMERLETKLDKILTVLQIDIGETTPLSIGKGNGHDETRPS